MKRIVSIRVAGFLLLAAGVAMCQNNEGNALPDAPSARVAAQAQLFQTFPVAGLSMDVGMRFGANARLAAQAAAFEPRKDSALTVREDFFQRHLYPALLKRNLNSQPSASSSLMGRAAYAASRILVTRDESGKGRLNTDYLVRVAASVMRDSASRPYWARRMSEPFSDFGSTIGNDAGTNVLHEFAPGIEQVMRSHAPRFVSRIEGRMVREQPRRPEASISLK